ncbi:hypothetical protein EG329_010493 [Mollisiaceae sp. DMI_Dod_QoI]|nr:hypothetical protein EG329_010493 [Helotiales sp. DMI_Dod_QoI]
MKLTTLTPLTAIFAILPSAAAWGSLGHETVAYIASNFVAAQTKNVFQTLLHNETSSYLASVATWADSFRYTQAGRFSAPFHYIDAEDNPPTSCGVTYSRDCGAKGCVVGAIQNYTSQLLDTTLDATSRNMAAKFIIHFVGDLHQPLHDEALNIGGNGVQVTFGGVKTNLHHVWDTNIPEKLIGGYSLADAEKWADALTIAIESGIYRSQAATWLDGVSLADPVTTTLKWATEANAFVCTAVLPNGVDALTNQELNGTYYQTAIPVVQIQIARAGYRLARWLDLIAQAVTAEGKPDL